MSNREKAMQLLEAVPDYKIDYVIAYLEGVTVGEEVPNTETIEAMKELENGGGEVFEGSTDDFLKAMLEE